MFQPDATVAAVVFQRGRMLLVEEDVHGRRVLNQPAGHLEAGESLLDAVVRETLEETGWTIRPYCLVGSYLWDDPREGRCYLRWVFGARPLQHQPDRLLDAGIHRAVWLSPSELQASTLPLRSPLVERAVHDFLAGSRLPLSAVQAP